MADKFFQTATQPPSASDRASSVRSAPRRMPVAFDGNGSALALLLLQNVMLTLVTLGLYWPWARTSLRRWFWEHTEVGGTRLRYHGTGRELFLGHLVWLGVMLAAASAWWAGSLLTYQLLVAGAYLLIAYSVFGAAQYLASRTSWRGRHFAIRGSRALWTVGLALGGALFLATGGLALPVVAAALLTAFVRRLHYGDQRAVDHGTVAARSGRLALDLLLTVLTLGLYWFWLEARLLRTLAEEVTLDGMQLESSIYGEDLFGTRVVIVLGSIATLGLAFPWLVTWAAQTLASKLYVVAYEPSRARPVATPQDGAIGEAVFESAFDL